MNFVFPVMNQIARSSFACAVCFGAKSSPELLRGLIISGVILLAFVFSILGVLIKTVYDMENRKNAVDASRHS